MYTFVTLDESKDVVKFSECIRTMLGNCPSMHQAFGSGPTLWPLPLSPLSLWDVAPALRRVLSLTTSELTPCPCRITHFEIPIIEL